MTPYFRLVVIIATLSACSIQLRAKNHPPATQPASSVSELATRLDSVKTYCGQARFVVSMPQMTDDVVYDVELLQRADAADRLATAPYLIDWTLTSHDSHPHGFSAYFNGNHFRFSGERLQEYHFDQDSIPFRPAIFGSKAPGVHRNVQFFNILPQGIADELRQLAADENCTTQLRTDTIVGGRRALAVRAIRRLNGVVASEAEYIFDPATSLPLHIALENNPGSISEQSVYVDFSTGTFLNGSASAESINEQWLASRYPEQFERFRQSNFSIEKLAGQRLPSFALPTSTGERYARRAGDPFRRATIVVLLDGEGGFTKNVIADVRNAIDRMPTDADVIWAFTDRVADRVEPLAGSLRPGEHLLLSAGPLVRDCGAASLPTIIICDRSGNVANIILGYNKDLSSDVIQKTALLR